MSVTLSSRPAAPTGIDPRGPRVVAALTSVVLAAALLTPPHVAAVILAVQAVAFGLGAIRGVQHTPYSWVFRTLVRPRLAAPTDLEDPRAPRFAQGVGLVFVLVGLAGYLAGVTALGQIAIGLALVAALLNAAVGLCLGCEAYLLLRRANPRLLLRRANAR